MRVGVARVPSAKRSGLTSAATEAPAHRSRSRSRHLEAGRRARQRLLLGRHVGRDALEQGRRQVALAGVGQHAAQDRALRRALGDLDRDGERSAARDAGEDPLFGGEPPRPRDRVGTGDRDQLVVVVLVDRLLQHVGNEVGSPALDRMRREGRVAAGRRVIGAALLRRRRCRAAGRSTAR